jgi:glyoxylase-like metal-dependent hydrolase (beta-lactamase superfamily II)
VKSYKTVKLGALYSNNMEVVKGIHRVEGIGIANVYLILDERIAVVDTGKSGDGQKILKYLGSLSRGPSDVSTIILTHYHPDHCGGLGVLKRKTGAQVIAHELESDYISGRKPIPNQSLTLKLVSVFLRYEKLNVDRTVRDGERLDEFGLRVIHTPGHTPGSICLLSEEKRVMFTGDTVGYSAGQIVGPRKAFSLDVEEAMRSVRRLSEFEFDVVLGGHGEPLIGNASAKIKEWI